MMRRLLKLKIWVFLLAFSVMASAQNGTKRVLFLGNSYTAVNDLPQVVSDLASSMLDTLLFDSNTPGGYTFQLHSTNSASVGKIMQGNWDAVVLQEQSQLPSFPITQVLTDCFPFARMLDSLITLYNPCGETMFYMTWGRKNGDASNCPNWPPVCTYAGMDSLLRIRYQIMADDNQAVLSPVSAVWRYLRVHYPNMELYQSDESHPSEAGTYAAACSFYTAIFGKDPLQIPYNYTLSPADAASIRLAAKLVVYDSLLFWNIGKYQPAADFGFTCQDGYQVSFLNQSVYASQYEWDFGDGASSTQENPVHSYAGPDTVQVTLVVSHCGVLDTVQKQVIPTLTASAPASDFFSGIRFFPNPANDQILIQSSCSFPTNCCVKVRDMSGKISLSAVLCQKEQLVDITRIAPGFYLISVENDKQELYKSKLVKY